MRGSAPRLDRLLLFRPSRLRHDRFIARNLSIERLQDAGDKPVAPVL